jgi:hypothetical protein
MRRGAAAAYLKMAAATTIKSFILNVVGSVCIRKAMERERRE